MPAPFGPIKQYTLPGRNESETPFTGVMPPNRLTIDRVSRLAAMASCTETARSALEEGLRSLSISNAGGEQPTSFREKRPSRAEDATIHEKNEHNQTKTHDQGGLPADDAAAEPK